jgi:4-aminobutyrate aminotransferase-like enzyme
MQTIQPGRKAPNHDLAHSIVERCYQKGLLLFSPVGAWGQTVKIAPPLTTPRDALEEGVQVLGEATAEAVAALVDATPTKAAG